MFPYSLTSWDKPSREFGTYLLTQDIQQSLVLIRKALDAREGDKKSGVVVVDPYWQEAVVKQLDTVSGDVSRINQRNVSKVLRGTSRGHCRTPTGGHGRWPMRRY